MCPEYNNNKSRGLQFHEFMSFMTRTIFHPDKRQQNHFIFQLYDVDGDGELTFMDIENLITNLPKSSPLGREINIIEQYIVKHQLIKSKTKILQSQRVTFPKFLSLINTSCLIFELQTRF